MVQTEIIADLYSANGRNPVYKISCGGKEFAFCLSLVGAPACVCGLEEVIAMVARKFVFFGCCGVLDDSKVQHRLIVPTAAVRARGPAATICFPLKSLNRNPVPQPYSSGVWKTAAIPMQWVKYGPQTQSTGKRLRLSAHGEMPNVCVDMEYSALLAAASYRDVRLVQFFYGSDCLANGQWQPRDLTDYGFNSAEKYMTLAFECGLSIWELKSAPSNVPVMLQP